jgi:GTP-binding protein
MNFNLSDFHVSVFDVSKLPKADRGEFVFCGRSNVGKSSLINKIVNRKALARTSAVPGKTACINYYRLDSVYLVDLPGYGYAKVSDSEKKKWAFLIEGYFNQERDLRLAFALVDFRHPPTADDIMMIEYLTESEIPFVLVLTKADKLSKTERIQRRNSLKNEIPYIDEIQVIEYSAKTGEGIEIIREIITELSEVEN